METKRFTILLCTVSMKRLVKVIFYKRAECKQSSKEKTIKLLDEERSAYLE